MVPLGGIIQWFGLLVDIPDGWQLCDGTNGTPDMQNKFVRGPPPAADPGGEGGTSKHKHPFVGNGHTHEDGGLISVAGAGPSDAWDGTDVSASGVSTGETDDTTTLPQYLALAFIQRMV